MIGMLVERVSKLTDGELYLLTIAGLVALLALFILFCCVLIVVGYRDENR